MRGFVREAIALAGWIAAVVLGVQFAEPLGLLLPFSIPWPVVRTLVGGTLIVVACVFVAALAGWLVRRLLVAARLGAADRVLGGVFGLLRAAAVLVLVVLFGGATPLAQQPAWRGSRVLAFTEAGVLGLSPWLPQTLAARAGARQ
jgi:membrane protein required for colicin V production